MGGRVVAEIVVVLGRDLPVGVERVAHNATGALDLAGGGAVDEVVDGGAGRAQIGHEVGAARGEAREDEAAIGGDAGHAGELERGAAEIVALGPGLPVGHAQERAVVAVGPAVIGAAEGAGVAALLLADHGAAVAAAVDEDVDGALGVAGGDNGEAGHAGGREVPGVAQLALMGDVEPGAAEDALHFQFEDGGVAVEAAVGAVLAGQMGDVPGAGFRGVDVHVSDPLRQRDAAIMPR